MYIGMIQVMKGLVMELNRSMCSVLGTRLPFQLSKRGDVIPDSVVPDDAFSTDMLDLLAYLRSDLREFYTVAAAPARPDTGAGAAGLTYYVNLAMIIGSHR
jgi:hypothetical protein